MLEPLDKLDAIRTLQKTIEANCYNHVRLALNRISNPCRIDLPGHRGLSVILNDDFWLCVDSARNDLPVMAWLEFDTIRHNRALHAPVLCRLRLYHMHAGLIMGSALDALNETLSQKLARHSHEM
jgi:hypothetical protein